MTELKPCPFCGVKLYRCEIENGERWAHEYDPAVKCVLSRKFIRGEEQIARWNTRTKEE